MDKLYLEPVSTNNETSSVAIRDDNGNAFIFRSYNESSSLLSQLNEVLFSIDGVNEITCENGHVINNFSTIQETLPAIAEGLGMRINPELSDERQTVFEGENSELLIVTDHLPEGDRHAVVPLIEGVHQAVEIDLGEEVSPLTVACEAASDGRGGRGIE